MQFDKCKSVLSRASFWSQNRTHCVWQSQSRSEKCRWHSESLSTTYLKCLTNVYAWFLTNPLWITTCITVSWKSLEIESWLDEDNLWRFLQSSYKLQASKAPWRFKRSRVMCLGSYVFFTQLGFPVFGIFLFHYNSLANCSISMLHVRSLLAVSEYADKLVDLHLVHFKGLLCNNCSFSALSPAMIPPRALQPACSLDEEQIMQVYIVFNQFHVYLTMFTLLLQTYSIIFNWLFRHFKRRCRTFTNASQWACKFAFIYGQKCIVVTQTMF